MLRRGAESALRTSTPRTAPMDWTRGTTLALDYELCACSSSCSAAYRAARRRARRAHAEAVAQHGHVRGRVRARVDAAGRARRVRAHRTRVARRAAEQQLEEEHDRPAVARERAVCVQHIVQRGAGIVGLTQKVQLSTATFAVAFALAFTPGGALGAYARNARIKGPKM